jgi:hypothetical protein
MQAWWDSLDTLLRVMYLIAIPSSVVLLIQIVLTIIGFGDAGAPDAGDASGIDMGGLEMDGLGGAESADLGFTSAPMDSATADSVMQSIDPDALRLFSMAGIISFLTVFGWSSIVLYQGGLIGALAVLFGFALGLAAMFGAAKIIQLTVRLSESGNLRLSNAINHTARVYIPIPKAGGGEGKVTLTLQERFTELSAVTDEDAQIPTGTLVRVVGVRGDALVVDTKPVSQHDSAADLHLHTREHTNTIGG